MGTIDSCLMPYDMGLELWGGPGTSKPVNFTIIPSSSKIKMGVLALLGDEEKDLQENETYLRAKIQTEEIVSIVSLVGVAGGIAKLIEGGIKVIGGTCFISSTGGASIPIAIDGVGDVALGLVGTNIAHSIGSNASNQSKKDKEALEKLEAASNSEIFEKGKKVFNEFNLDNTYVKPKHLEGSKPSNRRFLGDTKEEATEILKKAMSKGEIISIKEVQELTPMGNKKYEYIIDAGEGIGTRGENLIKIVLADDGGMVSAFPTP